MGRIGYGTYGRSWSAPPYTVDEGGKVVGGYEPPGRSNWGRFGDDDRRGTANLITPEHVVEASRLVRRGAVFSLALPLDATAPRWPNRAPHRHTFTSTGADAVVGNPHNATRTGVSYNDDAIELPTHLSTHWDALSHFQRHDAFYNGFWAGNVTSQGGDPFLGIGHLRTAGVGRGVLLDVARHLGVASLEQGQPIEPATLDDVCRTQGVEVREGDIVIVRTGMLGRWWSLATDDDRAAYHRGWPGPGLAGGEWLAERDVSAVACDTFGFEVSPFLDPSDPYPVHHLFLIDLGTPIGELWDLEALAADCAADGVYEFLLVAPPLFLPTAVGSPLNPIAIK